MYSYEDLLTWTRRQIASDVQNEKEARKLMEQLIEDLRMTSWKRTIRETHEMHQKWEQRDAARREKYEADRPSRIVGTQCRRAKKAGLPYSLTVDQWLTTIEHFQGLCAYCQQPYTTLEHFLPISCGGGTTADNCIPSCYACNNKKHKRTPDTLTGIFPEETLTRIREYLSSQSE